MKIFYPDNLPICKQKDDIIEAITNHQVVVIAGDTGSGKTTQIGKMCLEAFPEDDRLIGCTQPRRIAASTVAARVKEELGEYGSLVGYKIRFHNHTSKTTKIKFMTDGVLLAETKSDQHLAKYSVLIIDEAHERSLNIDFLLGYLKRLLPKRPDLKIIITSATIDTEAFSKHFSNAPVLTVTGRTYPVKVRYNPVEDAQLEEKEGLIDHCVKTVFELFTSESRGDILVFLPTERDIRRCCTLLGEKIKGGVILPMFGRLQSGDQKRIFQNFKQPKIVVATNVAETSITVPGIRYVVDSGLARISHYNVRAKTTSLPISKVSRASCDQRKGRCGRLGPGVCVRLYSEEDYENRPEYTLPELQRSNLAEVILQMILLKLGSPAQFPFLDPPHGNAISEGYRLLRELGAITKHMTLSKRGRIMSDLPVDPCISRIIIAAVENNCLREIKIISSVLAIQDPRIRPAEREHEADTAHKYFAHPHSDFMALLNIWDDFHHEKKSTRSWSKLKKYCKTHFLSFQRMREWFDLHEQLDRILSKREGFLEHNSESSYEQIHKSLLTGFLRNVALKRQNKIYQGTYNKEVMIFPGSHQFKKSSRWIVAAGFIQTNRLYALTVATIEPEWIESAANNLCKYSWSSPKWHKKSGQVIASEHVSLFALQIGSGKKVNFGERHKKNIREARNIFIQSALIQGEINETYPFLQHNFALLKKWEETENKLRTRGIIADDLALHSFYDHRIPLDVYDQKTMNRFLKKKQDKNFLKMKENDVLLRKPEENELIDYPPSLTIGSLELRLEYNFLPGSLEDGVTFRLPVNFAHGLSGHIFEWLVPGLLHEKLTFLLKGLPKNIRKKLVPVNNTVDRILDDITLYSGSLFGAIESSILKQFKLLIRRSDWPNNLPLYLQPRFVLFGSSGKEQNSGRNLNQLLKTQHSATDDENVKIMRKEDRQIIDLWEKKTFSSWEFAGLPAKIPLSTHQGEAAGFLYPALIPAFDRGYIEIKFKQNLSVTENLNRKGALYLYRLQFPSQFKSLKKMCVTTLSAPSALWFFESGLSRKQITDSLLDFIMRSIFGFPSGTIPTLQMYNAKLTTVKDSGLYKTGSIILNNLMGVLRQKMELRNLLNKIFTDHKGKNVLAVDKRLLFDQLIDEIFITDFLDHAVATDLEQLTRQLQSLAIRLERFSINPGKDAQKDKQLSPHLINLKSLENKADEMSTEAKEAYYKYLKMIAEYRISIFSPEIKTSIPVSAKKLQSQWQTVLTRH